MEKIKAILGSIRFWILTLTGVVVILEAWAASTLDLVFVFKTIEVWLAAIATLGTLDSVAVKFGAAFKGK
jgi:hypothetical protein